MNNSIYTQLFGKIIQQEKGSLLFPSDFLELGSSDAVRQSLSRMAKEKIIVRLGRGIYLYPKYDQELGMLYPSTEEIAEAIAKQEKARIIPTGDQALYKLGISTQVPLKVVYLTDGMRRTIKLGKRAITFKITTPKVLATEGKISSLVIQALQELGKNQVDDAILQQIKKALQKEDLAILRHDAKLAPVWIATILFSLLKELKHDRMVEANR